MTTVEQASHDLREPVPYEPPTAEPWSSPDCPGCRSEDGIVKDSTEPDRKCSAHVTANIAHGKLGSMQ